MRHWFLEKRGAAPLAVCKMGLGAILFLHYLHFALYSPDFFNGPPLLGGSSTWAGMHMPAWLNYLMLALVISFAALFALFPRDRRPGWGLVFTHHFFVIQFTSSAHGWPWFILPSIIYLSCVRIEENFTAEVWPRRLIQIQVCGMYFYSAGERIANPIWLGGNQIFYFLNGNLTRFPGLDLQVPAWLGMTGTYAGWGLEFAAPFLLMYKPTRAVAVILLLMLHLSIEAMGLLQWWSPVMILFLFCFFVPERYSEKLLARVRG